MTEAAAFPQPPDIGPEGSLPHSLAQRRIVRFEPGQTRDITLVPYQGTRRIFGFRGDVMGSL